MQPQKKIDHAYKIITGINTLLEKKAMEIKGSSVYIFRELLGKDEKQHKALMNNIYMYYRLKLKKEEGYSFYLMNIETKEMLGVFKNGQPNIESFLNNG
ncbi:MAG: hypothetical protein RIC03_12555 [Cyclobacteriaceae bacterium]